MISPGNEFAELAALSSSFVGRVTRLGVLSPIGQFFSLGSFLSAEAAHRGKIDLATCWAIFSRTHLVTLSVSAKTTKRNHEASPTTFFHVDFIKF
jgi:hypothetical protein